MKDNKFSCLIIGDDKLSVMCAEHLIADGHQVISFISSSTHAKQWATQQNIICYHDVDQFLGSSTLNPTFDYLFSIVNLKVLPKSMLQMARKLAINYHDSLLPRYAGLHAPSWALMNNEKEHGITWHSMSEGIDKGEILIQESIEIDEDETAFTLNLKCHQAALASFKKLVPQLDAGDITPQPQDSSSYTYFGRYHPLPNGGLIDWNNKGEDIDKICRALDHANQNNTLGSAKFILDNALYIIENHSLQPSSKQNPGVISELNENYIQIATTSKDFRLLSVKDTYGKVVPIEELTHKHNIRKGKQLIEFTSTFFEKTSVSVTSAAKHENFWIDQLQKINPLAIPFQDHDDKNTENNLASHKWLEFDAAPLADLATLYQDYATSAQIIIAAVLVYFYRINDCEAFSVAFRHSNHEKKYDNELALLFNSWKPLNINLNQEEPFSAALLAVKAHCEEIIQHKEILSDIFARYVDIKYTNLPLTIHLTDNEKQLKINNSQVNLVIDTAIGKLKIYFPENLTQAINQTQQHFTTFLLSLIKTPDCKIKNLMLLDDAQKKKILMDWNKTTNIQLEDDLLHQLFEQQADFSPDKTAIVFGDKIITYGELNQKANQLAHYINSITSNKNTRVILYLPRSIETIISLLAVLKSGNAYVPVAIDAPMAQVQEIITDCQAEIILTEKSLIPRIKDYVTNNKTKLVPLDETWETFGTENTNNLAPADDFSNLAYVIYTSGSTGKPKGVQISHQSFINALLAIAHEVNYSKEDVILAITPTTFDIAGLEIFLPLIKGARFILSNHEDRMNPHQIIKMIDKEHVTIMQATPATWQMLINVGWLNETGIKILCGGEALNVQLASQLHPLTTALWNLYGPSETTIWSTAYKINQINKHKPLIPIGKPIANTKVYILDKNLSLVPVGMPGILYIAGAGLAAGYLNKAELTHKNFITNPFAEEGYPTIYNTGDLAKWSADGNLEYIGRIDQQIKIRGLRVELGEIEACLLNYPEISQATVVYDTSISSAAKIIAYVIPRQKSNFNRDLLIKYLKSKIYNYMIPAFFVVLDELPLNANGKINKKGLPAPSLRDSYWQQALVLPTNKEQQLLAEIWSEVLALPLQSIGIHDNFFELGGHSLLAVQVITRIRTLFFVQLGIRTLFELPTIKELAAFIVASPRKEHGLPLLLHVKESQPQPLSPNQQRLWFLNELNKNSAIYNIVGAWRLSGELDRTILNKAIIDVIKRQGVFRTIFLSMNGKPKQILQPIDSVDFNLKVEYLTELSPKEVKQYLKRLTADPFELNEEKLFRFKLLHLSNNEHILFICLHHLIADGWSFGVLYRELSHFYQAHYHGTYPTLPSLPAQYVDFCAWQQTVYSDEHYKKQIEYWRKQLANISPLELPLDYPRPALQTYRGDSIYFSIAREKTAKLRKFSRDTNVTVFTTLLTAFSLLLKKYTNQTDITVGIPIANRNLEAVENLIGFFINTLVIRMNFSTNMKLVELLQQTMNTILDANANSDIPFEKLIDVLHPERDQSRSPIFQTMFAFNNAISDTLSFPKISASQLDIDFSFAHLELICFLEEKGDAIEGYIEYNMDLFSRETIQRMIDNYLFVLVSFFHNMDQVSNEIPILCDNEKNILDLWNHTKKDYPVKKNLMQLFEEHAGKNPNKTALIYQNQQVTYAELNTKANQLAHFIKKTDVGTGKFIAVYFSRSIETIVSFLAILKTGNAYIPIDINAATTLAENIVDDSKIAILLTMKHLSEKAEPLAKRVAAITINLDEQQALIEQEPSDNLKACSPDSLAYVLYTSGSTGKPKGVKIAQKTLVNLMFAMRDEINFTEKDILLAITPLTFDLSVPDVYLPLAMGGTFVLCHESVRFAPKEIIQYIANNKITIMQATPTTWQMLINSGWKNDTKIKMICGGEGLSNQLAVELHATNGTLWNFYGPTETTVWTSCYKVSSIDENKPSVSIGRALSNVQLYVLDSNLQLTPIGVAGELYIGGDGVGEGYLNNPQLTQEKFVTDIFSNDTSRRLYKTGDVVSWNESGDLYFIGRDDSQIKIRGHRIETEAIENILNKHPDIKESIVVDKLPNKERELAAYIILNTKSLSYTELRNYLSHHLPTYMIPIKFVIIDKFPLTYTGKIDRKTLPNITNFRYLSNPESANTATQNQYEKIIADIIKRLLLLYTVNLEANFFDMGAHSLLLVELSYVLSKELKRKVEVTEVFAYPTVRSLASYLNKENDNNGIATASDEITQRSASKKHRLIKKRANYVGK